MTAAESQGVVVQDGEVRRRLKLLRQGQPDFERMMQERFGSLDNLARQLKTEMIIDRTLRAEGAATGIGGRPADPISPTLVWRPDPKNAGNDPPSDLADDRRRYLPAGSGGSCCNRKS